MVTRRQFLYILGGTVAVAVLGGGVYFLTRTPSQQPQKPKTLSGKLTILGRSGYHETIVRNLMDTFSKKYPDVSLDYVPKGYTDEYQTIVLSMRNKSTDYDVLYIDEPWIHMMINNGWLLPIDQPDLSNYPDSLKSWPTVNGKTYAQAITGNANFLFYRKDILDSIGEQPPQTWDDVLRIAQKVKSKYTDVGVKLYGFGAYSVKGTSIAQDTFPAILYPFGGRYFADDGVTPALKSQEAIDALEFFKELKNYSHPRMTEFQSLAEYSDAILRGEVAVGVAWNGWLADIDNPQKSQVVGKIEVQPYPRQKTFFGAQSGVWYMAASAFTTNQDAAIEFVKVSTSFEAQKRAALEAGLPPTRLNVFTDADYKNQNRLADKFREIILNAKPVRTNPLWGDMAENVGTYLYMGLLGQISAEEAINKAYEEMVKVTSAIKS
jgi:multiple sugar transport system substrate-binding protein